MKLSKKIALLPILLLLLTSCSKSPASEVPTQESTTQIVLSDNTVTVDGKKISADTKSAVYAANDIIYYEDGKDFTYGEGTEDDAHSFEEAAAHTVIHITAAGTYSLSGSLSQGQIAVDLGENAEADPNAVVTLVLNGADITCTVAPAIIFYNVYECADKNTETATKDVDTSAAGANVIIKDGTENKINGSYVARIYKPDSVVLNDDNTEVADAKKLHKYDGAFYSKMSININGEKENTGILNINAENEGLDSELHLTINGGNINIKSGNDGINTNEDGVSVTTINAGTLNIEVTGTTGEGDGIDSNGWLVINGGTVVAAACADSADAGIDSDMGIFINGGTVTATGNMLDRIENSGQTYAVFNFAQKQNGNDKITLKNQNNEAVMTYSATNSYSVLIYSSPDLTEGTYTLFVNDKQLSNQGGNMPGNFAKPDMKPDQALPDGEIPEGFKPPENEDFHDRPAPPEGETMPEGSEPPEKPERPNGSHPDFNFDSQQEPTTVFSIKQGGNMFSAIA